MQTIYFAVGALLVTLLVMLILPLGITMKGKLLVTLTSFLLALGGIVAVTAFSLWQAALMLLALVLISAYFFDKRLNGLLYQTDSSFEEDDEDETEVMNHARIIADKKEESVLPNTLLIPLEKSVIVEENTEVLPNLEKTDANIAAAVAEDIELSLEREPLIAASQEPEELIPDTSSLSDFEGLLFKETIETKESVDDSVEEISDSAVEEDISFLLQREIELEVNEVTDDSIQESGYLSDIESMLQSETAETNESEEDPLDKLEVLALDKEDGLVDNPLDDSLFDLLNASKEVAADGEETLEVIDDKKKIANM